MQDYALARAVAAVGLLVCGGCVSADAGYAEVRQLTAERLKKDVRWYEHDVSTSADGATRQLLAQPLTADSAVQIALFNNPGLQAEFEELGIARARLVQALRLPNPSVDAAFRFAPGQANDPSVDVDALLDVTDLILLPLSGGAARADLEAAQFAVAGRVLDLAFETRVAFYAYQAAEQMLELRGTILAALRASFEAAERLHASGNITDLSFANERVLYEEARVAYTRAEAELRSSREELNARLGLWGPSGANWVARERLPPPSASPPELGELEARAVERSLDLQLSRRRFAAAARAANLNRVSGWLPELRAGVSAEREVGADADWTLGPAFELEVPLFYQGQGETGVSLAEMRREQRRYADVALRIRSAARAAAARLSAASKSVAYYRDVLLPLRQRIVDETQLQFNAMQVGVFQLLQAKRDQIETARAYVELLRDYWTAQAEVAQLLAGRLPTRGAIAYPSGAAGDTSAAPSGVGH